MDTMVCAGVEGGGTDSCEVRAQGQRGSCLEERGRGVGLGLAAGSRFACFGPEKMLGAAIWVEKAEQLERGPGWS